MRYVAHEAEGLRPAKNGGTQRDYWLATARRGVAGAVEKVEGPAYPEELSYLHGWFHELNGMRPEGVNSIAPFTPPFIESWAHLMDVCPEPHEVRALVALDVEWRRMMRIEPATQEAGVKAAPPGTPWPTKKSGAVS